MVCLAVLESNAKNKVVAFTPVSGEWTDVGLNMRAAYEAATLSVTGALPFELILEDCGDPEILQSKLDFYSKDAEVIAFIGGMPSSASRQIAQVSERERIPYLIDCNAADTLTQQNQRYVFRIVPPTGDFNDGIVSWAATVAGRGRDTAVLFDSSARYEHFITDLDHDLANHWDGNKIWLPFASNAHDFSFQTAVLKESNPAIVFLIGSSSDLARFLRYCRESDYSPYGFILGTIESANNRLISAAEGAADYIVAPRVWNPNYSDRKEREFGEAYKKLTADTPDFRAAACASSIDILAQLVQDPGIVGREHLRLQVAEGTFGTYFGNVQFIDYSSYKNQNRSSTIAIQYLGDSWRPVWPQELATFDDLYPIPDWRERVRQPFERPSIWPTWLLSGISLIMIILYIKSKFSSTEEDDL